MPELPEIETVRLGLQKYLVGQRIQQLETQHPKSVCGNPTLIQDKKIISIDRKGKLLIINLTGKIDIAIHFKMSGQLILVRSNKRAVKSRVVGGHPTIDWVGTLPSNHTRAIFYLDSGDKLFFNDQRIFGWVRIFEEGALEKLPFIKNLGPEPWDIDDEHFVKLLAKRKKAIKLVLMDQEIISGVGNIYANDALWEAKIHPRREAKSLRQEDCKTLRKAIIKVLKEGIKYGGATASDAKYIDLDGLGGHYQDHFRVYDREGKKCLRGDGGIIAKTTLGGRGTYFCPVCQS